MSLSRANFGRNVRIEPRRIIVPRSEVEVLDVLRQCATEGTKVHAVGSLHSWSTLSECTGVLLDLSELRHLGLRRRTPEVVVEAGAGCTIGDVLEFLRHEGLTLPTLGAVDKQTVAGAVATATHGSGLPSLSHFVKAMRIACIDSGNGQPGILDFDESIRADDFRAARVGLGYLGVVVSVTLATVPQYFVEESLALVTSLKEDVLGGADIYPLQQFAVVPYSWRYYVFRRRIPRLVTTPGRLRRIAVWAYRAYKLVVVDTLLHGIVNLMASWSRGPFIRAFYGKVFPVIALRDVSVVDRSDRVLTLRHDMYTHLEMEVFVPQRHVEQALTLVRHLTEAFSCKGQAPDKLPDQLKLTLKAVPGAMDLLREKYGTFTYHYIINCRRILPETALLAMTVGDQVYYSLSFFTFDVENTGPYLEYCRLLAHCLVVLYGARLHWGKYFPLDYERGAKVMYPERQLQAFRDICQRYDPQGLMGNRYAREILGFDDAR